jgi:hypothetical protein
MITYQNKTAFWLLLLLVVLTTGCAKQPSERSAKKIPAGKEFSGFLKDYSNLKPNSGIDGNALTYARTDVEKNLHKYIGIVVDPVDVYLASDADDAKLSEEARQATANYYHQALIRAVSSAFPVAEHGGPLVLRLRAAIIGVDVGGEVGAVDKSSDSEQAIHHAVNIGKVGVEMELLDSETGEQIAAMVDREPLGAGAEIGSVNFSKQERWAAAREAFDGWAHRVRQFLDSAHTLSEEDAKKVDQSYRPYGGETK